MAIPPPGDAGKPRPFCAGSVSLRLYAHGDLPADAIVATLRAQARHAADVGFDGVMTSEHHLGFPGYLPNPIQAAGWALEAMTRGWAAPCPLLLPLRPAALVIEEMAWLAARFPGRVGVGLAAGSLQQDFTVMGLDKRELTERFAVALTTVTDALLGRDAGMLAADPAVARCVEHPVPVLSAAVGHIAARRAAAAGAGMLLDSLVSAQRCRALVDSYREAGGTGDVVLIRRAWVGDPPPGRHERQVGVYRSYAGTAQTQWTSDELVTGDADEVAARLVAIRAAAGADALNLRLHVPGIAVAAIQAQLDAIAPVVNAIRRAS